MNYRKLLLVAASIGLLGMSLLPEASMAQRRVSEESSIFQALKNSVFVLFGDEGRGSGFLVDSSGLVLTNQHVVASSLHTKVGVDDSTVVPATVLLADAKKDVAVLLIHPDFVRTVQALTLRRDSVDLAMEGEQVLAIGSPLHQARILTTGVVSKVESDVIISDVNINHGNSGGPLINLDKEVIGITTFADLPESGGPGVSGIVRIDQCFALIDSAKSLLGVTRMPEAKKLPLMPKDPYPITALQQLPTDKKLDTKPYQLSKSGFNIEVQTPPFNYWQDKQYERRLVKDREKREKKGKAQEGEKFNSNETQRNWYSHVGVEYPAVVVIDVIPKVGEKTSSKWNSIFGAALGVRTTHNMEFKGDLKDMILLSSGMSVEEILRGMSFIPLDFFEATWGGNYSGQDLAKAGQFIFPVDVFRPIDSGWPSLQIVLTKIDKPDQPDTLTVPEKTVRQVWEDFKPYFETLNDSATGDH